VAERAAVQVADTTVAAVRDLADEYAFMADLFGAAAATAPATRQDLAEAAYLPAAALAQMESAGDQAFERFGADLVAKYASLDANPNIQLGVTR